MSRGFARLSLKPMALSPENEVRREALLARSEQIVEECQGCEPEDGPILEEYQQIEASLEELDDLARASTTPPRWPSPGDG
jgi:hypothetical protein